jgi:hypothetical protein
MRGRFSFYAFVRQADSAEPSARSHFFTEKEGQIEEEGNRHSTDSLLSRNNK